MVRTTTTKNQLKLIGKLPPQSLVVEEIIIGSLLLDFSRIGFDILNTINSDMFYNENHRLIFNSIENLHKKSSNIDIITVENNLKENGNLEIIGGLFFLLNLTKPIASTENINEYCEIIIDKYLKRKLINDLSENINKCFSEEVGSIDCIDSINKTTDEINSLLNKNAQKRTLNEILKDSIDNAEKRQKMRNNNEVIGIPTPLKELDYKTNGWQNGDLIILAARPSMGKTSFALACLKEASKSGKSVCIFSLEMNDISIADRLLCAESEVDLGDYKRGNISDVDWEKLSSARTRLLELNITIDDNSSASMEYIKNKSRILKRNGKCDMIIIDYIQLQEGDKRVNREQQVSDISRKSKLLAKELKIPVMQLSQLNRSLETRGGDKKPQLSDLRESGAIEQDADMVMFLYRPSVYGIVGEDGRDLSGEGMVIISKNREGSTGEVKYNHNKSLTNYYPYLSNYNNNSFEETDTPF